ncbi:MAG: ethylbenzene dehydrogenase-related protein [Candidatus Neomarinimicrobiota bacterium]
MKIKSILTIAMIGLLAWSFNGCEGAEGPTGPQGTAGADGTDGTTGADGTAGADGADLTALAPAGTFFSLAVNNNAGDMQFGSFVNYLAFDEADADVTASNPDAPQVVSLKTPLPPEIDGIEAEGEWLGAGTTITLEQITDFEKYDGLSPAGVSSVKVKAAYDDDYVYFQLSWDDADNSFEKDKLEYSTTGGWSKSGNEDRFYFMWPITGYPDTEFADGNGCDAFCHYDEASANGKGYMFTEWPDQLVDTWQWKATRGNPIGFVHDKHLIYQDAADLTDLTTKWSGRKGDQGNDPYIENKLSGSYPLFMHISDPDANEGYPSFDYEMVPFDQSAVFSDGATIPGVFLRSPEGSGADVHCIGVYSDGGWLVEVRRLRNTGHGDDHQFLPE